MRLLRVRQMLSEPVQRREQVTTDAALIPEHGGCWRRRGRQRPPLRRKSRRFRQVDARGDGIIETEMRREGISAQLLRPKRQLARKTRNGMRRGIGLEKPGGSNQHIG